MTSIFSSLRSLEVLAALEQRPDGLRLVQLADAVNASGSSVQAALRLLIGAGLVARRPERPPVYGLDDRGRGDTGKLLDVACARTAPAPLLAAALRASRAVEFASLDHDGLFLVVRWDAEPSEEVRLKQMLARLRIGVLRMGHDDLRELLIDDTSLRDRGRRAQVIVGSADRSFPDASRHGSPDAPFLGGLHPTVERPSRRALRDLARRFELAEVRVFGSAVHADLRPDSDIDVMVRRRPGAPRMLEGEVALRGDLEALFRRDVDVVDASLLGAAVRTRVGSESVLLFG